MRGGVGYPTGTVTPVMIHCTANMRVTLPCLTPQDRRADWPALELLHRVGARPQAFPGQITIAWLVARSPSISPIPGPITHDQMDQNMETQQGQPSAADMEGIENCFAHIQVQGATARADAGVDRRWRRTRNELSWRPRQLAPALTSKPTANCRQRWSGHR